jgi:hypothetical protein
METLNTTKQVSLSEKTGLFINALKQLNEAEETLLTAMSQMYGEEQGTKMTFDLPFEDIRKEVSFYLYLSIMEAQEDNENLI